MQIWASVTTLVMEDNGQTGSPRTWRLMATRQETEMEKRGQDKNLDEKRRRQVTGWGGGERITVGRGLRGSGIQSEVEPLGQPPGLGAHRRPAVPASGPRSPPACMPLASTRLGASPGLFPPRRPTAFLSQRFAQGRLAAWHLSLASRSECCCEG